MNSPHQSYFLQEKDKAIIRAIGSYWYLTPEQVMRLFWEGNSIGRAKERLLTLQAEEYISRIQIPKYKEEHRGRPGFAYRLAYNGWRFLRDEGADVPRRLNLTHAPGQQLPHTLAANDVLINAALLRKWNDQILLSRFVHEKTLHNTKPRVTLPNGRIAGFELDGVLLFDIHEGGQTYEQVALLEVDMGNTQKYWLDKLEKLMVYVKGSYKSDYQTETFTFLTYSPTSDTHRQNLVTWTERFFTDRGLEGSAWPSYFFFTNQLAAATDPRTFFLDPLWSQPFTPTLSSPLEVGDA